MIIERILKNKSQSDDIASDEFKEFEKLKKEFENAINYRLIPCDKKENGGKLKIDGTNNPTLCGDCCLEFFWYYDTNDKERSAVWIKVNNVNCIEIWIRVNIITGKKINVYTDTKFKCKATNTNCLLLSKVKYGLPQNFNPKQCLMTHKGRQPIPNNGDWSDIVQEICDILPCLCNAI